MIVESKYSTFSPDNIKENDVSKYTILMTNPRPQLSIPDLQDPKSAYSHIHNPITISDNLSQQPPYYQLGPKPGICQQPWFPFNAGYKGYLPKQNLSPKYYPWWVPEGGVTTLNLPSTKTLVQHSIPNTVYQTYYDRSAIPKKVYKNIYKYSKDYHHYIFNDDECIVFLKNNYPPVVLEAYFSLKTGAHRADLFRYCLLYKFGGIYLDIKTHLITPLKEIFNKNYLYSCIDFGNNVIYQGVIASPPNNPIFKILIDFIVENRFTDITNDYGIFTKHFYDTCQLLCKNKLVSGLNINRTSNINIYLFNERCSENSDNCYDGLDRYNKCCNIYDKDTKIIKTRYSDYPWN